MNGRKRKDLKPETGSFFPVSAGGLPMGQITADSLGADVNTLTAETSFKEDLGADSLDLFEMVMALEEEFEVEIPTEDLENIKTIGDVEAYLQSRQ